MRLLPLAALLFAASAQAAEPITMDEIGRASCRERVYVLV